MRSVYHRLGHTLEFFVLQLVYKERQHYYLATLSSVDVSLHEAAKVDGANTWQRILHIDIPVLVPIIVIQLIMSFGSLMNVGFEKVFLMQNDLNMSTSASPLEGDSQISKRPTMTTVEMKCGI